MQPKRPKTADARAFGIRFSRGRLMVTLVDDRKVSVPLEWYPTLERATPAQRSKWVILGDGLGFHWEALDLDLSVAGITNGFAEAIPEPPPI